MSWEIFSLIGTVAFALSGAIIASEEDYDLIGYYALGFITAFGGGAIRNLLIGVPVSALWNQGILFFITFLLLTLAYLLPFQKLLKWKRWKDVFGLLDAIGLSAFSIQGTLYAKNLDLPLSAMVVSSFLTGVGGGIIRDVLVKRQPYVFKYDLYACWTILIGIIIGSEIATENLHYYLLFTLVVVCRMLTLRYGWHIPRPKKKIL